MHVFFMQEKIKIHFVTADFGSKSHKNFIIPEQNNINYEITKSCYTDFNTENRKLSLHSRLKGKIPKMLEWMNINADYYIWIDSKFNIISNQFVEFLIEKITGFDLVLFKHPERSSIREEFLFVEENMMRGDLYLLQRYNGESMRQQVNCYLNDQLFQDDNLFCGGILMYSANLVRDKNYNFMTDWFFHNCYWSIQDQLSLPYLLQKHKVKYNVINDSIYNNKYVKHSDIKY